MPRLNLFCFGPPRLERDGEQVAISLRKAMALLTYLAVTQQPHSRDALATLFWPDDDQSKARGNLRRTLSRLNKAVGKDHLAVDRENAGIVPESNLWLDVEQFQRHLAECQDHDHATNEVCADCLPILTEAVAIYTDDFLAGFTLPDCPDFDEWQFFQSENLRQELASALERLIQGLREHSDYDSAILHARRRLALDPLHEPAHYQLMELYAHTGQQAAALRQYNECVRILEEELGVPPLAETTNLYEAIKTNRRSLQSSRIDEELAQHPGSLIPPHNLPPQPTSFIGRENELAALDDLIANPDVRLITIVGPGGMGKTRLAIQAANDSSVAFADGTWFVPLTPISSDEHLPSAIADALNLKFYGSKPPPEQLLNHLRDQQLLLLLDNFEHVLAGADLLTEIVLAAPQVKLLVTSRERLNLQPEWVYELLGLTYPATDNTTVDLETVMATYSSIGLFAQRARQAQATFAPSSEDLFHIVRISQIVDGMPLALELAAAWLPLMFCAEIADEIERNFDFLATTLRDVPERHRSLRAVFRHSWSLLTAEEQAVYRQLSVFRGGFTREAVEHVTNASLPQLANLMGKSLLWRTSNGRYEIHELLRQYAAEKLAESPAEQEATYATHAAYFATFLQQRTADLRGSRQLEAVAEIAADFDNVRQCWQWLVDHRDADKLYQATWPMLDFCQLSGQGRAGEQTFRLAVEALPAWSEETATKTQRMVMGRLLSGYGWLAPRVGSRTDGSNLCQQSAALLRPLQPAAMRELASTLCYLGYSQYMAGDASARQSMEESLALARAASDNFLIGTQLMNMGQTAEAQGEYRLAETYFQESAKILGAIGEKYYRSYTLNNWGRAAYGMGQYVQAEQLIQEALPIRREFDDQISVSYSRLDLGKLAFMRGAYVEAERQIHTSLEIAERKGTPEITAHCYNALGWMARVQGNLAQAEAYHQQSLIIYRESGQRLFLPLTLNGLAQVAFEQQEYEQARQYLEESLVLGQELANVGAQAVALGLLGHIAVAEGALAESARYYRQALKIVVRTGAAPVALEICIGVAQLYLNASPPQPDQAALLLSLARDHLAATQETRDRARTRLADLPAGISPTASPAADLWETVTSLIADLTNLEAERDLTPTAIRHNLPSQPTPFIGRETELAALGDLIAKPEVRLVTIVGPGGMGKTRLAIQAATESLDAFADGVYFVPFAPISSDEFLVTAIAETLGISFYGATDPKAQLLQRLRNRKSLLILDNFEHVLEGAILLSEMVLAAPGLKLLVTSRERLNLQEEWVYELQGMAYPGIKRPPSSSPQRGEDDSASPPLGGIEGGDSALQLFEQRARQVQANFDPNAEYPAVVRICQLVDGMPLGLELAATWVKLMSCQKIAAEIEKNLDFLATSMRNMLERHRSLRAVFRHSWQLLSDEEQDIFKKLSVFRGGFTREAAEQVVGVSLPLLATLVDKSLLRRRENGRYDIHELLRQYAAENLREGGESETIQTRHSLFYTNLLHERLPDLKGSRQLEAARAISTDIDNIRAAWRWAVDHGDERAVAKSWESLFWYYERLVHNFIEGETAFQQAVMALSSPLSMAERKSLTKEWSILLGQLQGGLAVFFFYQGRMDEAMSFGQQSVSLLRQIGREAQEALALALVWFSGIRSSKGEYTAAIQNIEESLAIFTEVGDQYGQAVCVQGLGFFAEIQGNYTEALSPYRRSIEMCQQIGERVHKLLSINGLGRVTLALGDYAEAKKQLKTGLQLRQENDDRFGQAGSLAALGELALAEGNLTQAEAYFQESQQLSQELNIFNYLGPTLNGLGSVARLRGAFEQAEQFYQESLTLRQREGNPRYIGISLNYLGRLAFDQKAYARAEQLHKESLSVFQEIDLKYELASTLRFLGHVAVALGRDRYPTARQYFRQALEITLQMEVAPIALDVLHGYAALLMADEPEQAQQRQAIELLTLTQHHPAGEYEAKEKAGRLLAAWTPALPPEIVETAQKRGRVLDLWETSTELLEELTEQGWDK